MMIFAIRDRMLNYYQRPIFADRPPDVVSAVAAAINGGGRNDYCQAPEHFEIWKLGEIDPETGVITPQQTILFNCASLVRDRSQGGELRGGHGAGQHPGARQASGAGAGGERTAPPSRGTGSTANGAIPHQMDSAAGHAPEEPGQFDSSD